jgi:hypothetical protein
LGRNTQCLSDERIIMFEFVWFELLHLLPQFEAVWSFVFLPLVIWRKLWSRFKETLWDYVFELSRPFKNESTLKFEL